MSNQYATPVPATQVGSYFVQQYYQVFQQQREFVHQFYNDSSSMMRVDGDISHSASDMAQIHQLIMSFDFTGIEIKTINSLESWNGGVLVVVTGSVKSRNISGRRKFIQTFFLAPQEKGYFVLNDMFHFADELMQLPSVPGDEQDIDYQPTISTELPDQPVRDYALEEAGSYVYSNHTEEHEPVSEYSHYDQKQQKHEPQNEPEPQTKLDTDPKPDPESKADRVEKETFPLDSNALLQSTVTSGQETQPPVDEPAGEPGKLTYASILRAKGQPKISTSSPLAFPRNMPPAAVRSQPAQPLAPPSVPTLPTPAVNAVQVGLPSEEGVSKSVYVRNLSSTVTNLDIMQEFQKFGKIKQDGVFLKNRVDTGVCFAFVEFEDVESAKNAVKASPIQLAGRRIYVEERRSSGGASHGGGRGGRGRGGGRGRSSGRGSDQNGSFRTNGLQA